MGAGLEPIKPVSPSLKLVAGAILLATLAEFAIARVAVNAIAVMPKEGSVLALYAGIAALGAAATRLAHLLAIAVSIVVALRWMRPPSASRSTAVPLLALAQLSALSLLLPPGFALTLGFEFTFFAAVGFFLWQLASRMATPAKLLAVVVGSAYAASAYFRLAPLLREALRLAGPTLFAGEALAVAEGLAVASSAAVFLAFRSPQTLEERGAGRWIVVPSVLAVGFAMVFARAPWVTAVATTWTLSFSLFMPWPVYAVAIWLYAYTITQLAAKRQWAAAGLVLILLAGLLPQPPYQSLLAALGVAWLVPPTLLGAQ